MKWIRSTPLFSGHMAVRCLGILVCTMAMFLPAYSQTYRNSINGFVFDLQRRPVTQIPVELTNEVNQVLQRTKTDGSGRYFFGGISAGRFTVRVLPYGTDFEEQSGDVEIINFVRPGSSTSDSQQKDFYLRPRRQTADARLVTGTLFAQEVPDEAKKAYEKGLAELEGNRTDAGMESLLKAVKIFPDYYLALERLGREYTNQQKYDYARAAFLKTVSVNERSFNGWYGLSYASYALKQPATGISAAQKAVELNPSSVDAMLMLGILQRQARQFREAENSLLKAKKLAAGQKPDVHWNLALLYANDLNRFKDAADELELYLKISTDESKKESVKKLIAEFRQKASNPK